MSTRYLLPSAIDYLRTVNDNVVDNLLAAQPGYAQLPTLYQRAYVVVHGTGAVRIQDRVNVPAAKPVETRVDTSYTLRRKR